MNLLLGKLYVNVGLHSKAEESYTTALRQNPYALEAVVALTKLAAAKDPSVGACLGSDSARNANESARSTGEETLGPSRRQHEIERFYPGTATTTSAGLSRLDAMWTQNLVAAHMDAERCNYKSKSLNNGLKMSALLELLCL